MKPSDHARLYIEDVDNDYAPEDMVAKVFRAYLRLREAAQAIFDSAIEVYGDLDTDADSGIYARDILAALGPAL